MQSKNAQIQTSLIAGLALALALATYAPSAHANVYATNIKINGVLKGVATVGTGRGATITYILNEPASAGVTIKVLSGATAVRTISIAGGNPGTTQGLNSVVWDGKDDSNANVALGPYTVQVTAASNGYGAWTQIINNLTDIYWPSGIAVDTRTDSAYYGRIMVANGADTVAHNPGIFKFNADGSLSDEPQSNAGNPFRTDGFLGDSCRSLKYGADDRVYFNDWVGDGKCTACDMIMSTNQVILDTDLVSGGAPGNCADIDVTDAGTTNALVWFADANYPSSGVWCWPLTNNGVADPAFGGFNIIGTGPNIPLRTGFGMMWDNLGDLFIGEVRANTGDPNPRAINITNVWGASVGHPTNWWNTVESFPITATDLNWAVGQNDDTFRDVADVAVDSRTSPKYVSCAMNGASGGMRILNAADGTLVVNINQGGTVFYIGTCWDNVGNVYAGNADVSAAWQAFSPPGANSATTPAVATIQVMLVITSISVSGGTVTIDFNGGATDPSSAFTLIGSAALNPLSGYTPVAGATITGSGGSYQATAPTSGDARYYLIRK